jgi:hypothetical protein
MRRVFVFILLQLLVFNCFAKVGKKGSSLKNITWNYAILLDGETINSTDELNQQLNILFNASYFDGIENIIKGNAAFICTLNLPYRNADLTLLSLPTIADVFDVWLNGKKQLNLQKDDNFVADISSFVFTNKAVLIFKFKKDYPFLNDFKYTDFVSLVSDFNVYSYFGLSVARFETKKMQNSNNYMFETHLVNYTDKDFDCKVYGRLIDKDTRKVIIENSNSVSIQSGKETIVNVAFPDKGSSIKPGQYIGEVGIVDKVRKDKIIDKLSSLITIK